MYLYRGHSASVSLVKEDGVDEESNKNMTQKRGRAVKKIDILNTNSSMYVFL